MKIQHGSLTPEQRDERFKKQLRKLPENCPDCKGQWPVRASIVTWHYYCAKCNRFWRVYSPFVANGNPKRYWEYIKRLN